SGLGTKSSYRPSGPSVHGEGRHVFCWPNGGERPSSEEAAVNRTTFDTMWDQIRQKYGVYLRLIEALPEAQLQMRPIPGMRSPAELVAHLSSGIVRAIVVGIAG